MGGVYGFLSHGHFLRHDYDDYLGLCHVKVWSGRSGLLR